jgi:hypothetical protein
MLSKAILKSSPILKIFDTSYFLGGNLQDHIDIIIEECKLFGLKNPRLYINQDGKIEIFFNNTYKPFNMEEDIEYCFVLGQVLVHEKNGYINYTKTEFLEKFEEI